MLKLAHMRVVLLLLFLAFVGCGDSPKSRADELDEAREAVEVSLDLTGKAGFETGSKRDRFAQMGIEKLDGALETFSPGSEEHRRARVQRVYLLAMLTKVDDTNEVALELERIAKDPANGLDDGVVLTVADFLSSSGRNEEAGALIERLAPIIQMNPRMAEYSAKRYRRAR